MSGASGKSLLIEKTSNVMQDKMEEMDKLKQVQD